MISIALLVPVCSRNQNYKNFNETAFIKIFYNSFLNTYNPEYQYTIYIGIDITDSFYIENFNKFSELDNEKIRVCAVVLRECENSPVLAWNKLFEISYSNHDYFYQLADDTKIIHPWAQKFIKILLKRNNIGIVSNGSGMEKIGNIAHLFGEKDWIRLSLDSGKDETFQKMHN